MELKQSQEQHLKMAPMLLEAINLLQFNQVDLNVYLKEKTLENPLLNLKETERLPIRLSKSKSSGLSTTDIIENTISNGISYREDLKQQVRIYPTSEINQRVLFDMIDNLDERGYWNEQLEEWAVMMAYPLQEVETAFRYLRSLEPAGIGAESFQDCLLLQVERLNTSFRDALTQIISDYLELLANEEWEQLQEVLGLTFEEIQTCARQIKSLTPFPVKEMDLEPVNYIIPDLVLEKVNDHFFLRLDNEALPKLTIDQDYYNDLLASVHEKKARSYIQKKFSEADWLVKGLARREETLFRIVEVLNDHHGHYLDQSPDNWPPLTLKEVAEPIGIHESTVSRAIKEKYVKTPFGVIELKRFFPKGFKQSHEMGISVDQVKEWIRDQINSEDQGDPLSDQDLANWLNERKGLPLSRRVISKYRAELRIPSSKKRREVKKEH